MSLAPGTRLGSFDISARIGVGGMGEVYRATDLQLKRQVAIKVLAPALAGDSKALVMELVEGPTLAERIARGALPVDEARA